MKKDKFLTLESDKDPDDILDQHSKNDVMQGLMDQKKCSRTITLVSKLLQAQEKENNLSWFQSPGRSSVYKHRELKKNLEFEKIRSGKNSVSYYNLPLKNLPI